MTRPGSDADRLAEALAADLVSHASAPVTRAAAELLARAAADARGVLLIGWTPQEALALLTAVAGKLEMQASA